MQDFTEGFMQDEKHFARYIGMKITRDTPDLVEATLEAREELSNRGGFLHGGAIMTVADTLGGFATMRNLPKGYRTLTLESKTNFLAPIPVGDIARGECTPIHRGKTTMIWQTKIFRKDGKLAALVTQTQMVIPPPA